MPIFACHRCRQPLLLPSSLSSDHAHGGTLTQSAYDVIEAESVLLRHPLRGDDVEGQGVQGARIDSMNDHGHGYGSGGIEGFPDHEHTEKEKGSATSNSLSSHISLTTSLFDLLSTTAPPSTWAAQMKPPLTLNSPAARKADQDARKRGAQLPIGPNGTLAMAIDHPLCGECTNILLSVMEAQLDELRRERDAYLAFEEEVERRVDEGDDLESTKEQIDALLRKSEEAQHDLMQAQTEADQIDSELRALDEEERKLEEEEKRFWQSMSALATEASDLSAQRSSLQASLAHDRAQLNRLELTNVFNDAFAIGYDGGYATINGLRLGRMPNDPRGIEWSEINAAWGQTAFLLVTLARRCKVTFEEYKVHPIGSFSTVEKLSEQRKEVYELYGSGDWQLGRLLTDRRFDHAMVAFLDCLRQLCSAIQQRDESLKLPHTILRDKIGGASIRLQFGSDETWTRALRNILMTLKIVLAWTINSPDQDDWDNQDGSLNVETSAH